MYKLQTLIVTAIGSFVLWTLPAQALSPEDTRHLLERTAFGGSTTLQQSLCPFK